MESVIILAGLIVMSVIVIKRKSIHIGMLTLWGVIVAGHKSSTECMWNSKA